MRSQGSQIDGLNCSKTRQAVATGTWILGPRMSNFIHQKTRSNKSTILTLNSKVDVHAEEQSSATEVTVQARTGFKISLSSRFT